MKNILIVEDDMIISLVVENMVRELGHQVIGKAVSGEEAIELALEKKSVIYLTGNSDKLNYDRAKNTNFTDLIVKPFTINDLSNSLKLVV